MRSAAAFAAIIILVMLGAVLAARVFAPGMLPTGGEQAHLAYLVGWLAMLSGAIFLFGRMPIGHALRSLLIWAGIGLFLVAAYTLRDDFGDLYAEVRGEIVPSAPRDIVVATEDGEAQGVTSVRRAGDGHFWADARVNGAPVRFLVDTGASTVALSEEDARRAGLNPASLRYTAEVMTAGGTARGAPVRINNLAVGSVRLENVQAIVIEGDTLQFSLLGMSFLGRLSRYEATQDRLLLER